MAQVILRLLSKDKKVLMEITKTVGVPGTELGWHATRFTLDRVLEANKDILEDHGPYSSVEITIKENTNDEVGERGSTEASSE